MEWGILGCLGVLQSLGRLLGLWDCNSFQGISATLYFGWRGCLYATGQARDHGWHWSCGSLGCGALCLSAKPSKYFLWIEFGLGPWDYVTTTMFVQCSPCGCRWWIAFAWVSCFDYHLSSLSSMFFHYANQCQLQRSWLIARTRVLVALSSQLDPSCVGSQNKLWLQ